MPVKRIRQKALISTKDKVVDEMMERLQYSYISAISHFERMERLQQGYDNTPDSALWPTISELPIPIQMIAVEEQLPFAMKYLFPKNRFLNLMPQRVMDYDVMARIEKSLQHTVVNDVDLELATFPSVKDCFKLGVGYGLVDTQFITPPTEFRSNLNINGMTVASTPQIGMGKSIQIPSYKYIPPSSVIPMPDGANVEGPNRASGHFVVVMYTEDMFRDMFNQKGLDGKPMLSGDVDKIIDDARHLKFDYRIPPVEIIAEISGIDINRTNPGDERMPIVVPVVRCYFDHHHVWIANGKTRIHEVKDQYQCYRSDLTKWSAWPDGDRWFPVSAIEASERMAWGVNIWYNAMIDLAMYHMNPTRVVNMNNIDDSRDIARGPAQDIKVRGNPDDTVSYLTLPQMPQQIFSVGEIFQRFFAKTNSQGPTEAMSPGLVRGGTNALESLLASSTGRQLLASVILKSGGLKPAIEKILIKKQLLMPEDGESFIETAYDKVTGKKKFEEVSVTIDEIRQVMKVDLDLPISRLNSAASIAERAAYFDRAERRPELYDWRAMSEELTEDQSLVNRTMLPEEIVRERQNRMAEARMKNAEAGRLPEAGGAPPTQGQQALAGAAATGGMV